MAEIVQLHKPIEETNHLVGTAKCLDCGIEWKAVAPVGTTHLECPNCATSRGVLAGPVDAHVGEGVWECNCGCNLFKIVADAHGKFQCILCIKCGLGQKFA